MNKGRANEMDKLVAKRIKIARLLCGLSQQELAHAIDVSIQQIQKYEKSTNRISSGRLYYLAQFLNLPITYFFNKNENDKELINIAVANINEKETVNLIKSFNLIKNIELKKHLLTVVQLIAKH